MTVESYPLFWPRGCYLQQEVTMTDTNTQPNPHDLIACYLSGQMSEAEWEEWCAEIPALRACLKQTTVEIPNADKMAVPQV